MVNMKLMKHWRLSEQAILMSACNPALITNLVLMIPYQQSGFYPRAKLVGAWKITQDILIQLTDFIASLRSFNLFNFIQVTMIIIQYYQAKTEWILFTPRSVLWMGYCYHSTCTSVYTYVSPNFFNTFWGGIITSAVFDCFFLFFEEKDFLGFSRPYFDNFSNKEGLIRGGLQLRWFMLA